MKTSLRQQGIALGVVLVVVALLGAISYAVVASSRTGSTDVSTEKSRLLASTLLMQAQNLKDAYARLEVSGVDLSASLNMNPGEPDSIYGPVTGLPVQVPPREAGSYIDSRYSHSWKWSTQGDIRGLGTPAMESIFGLLVTESVCRQINKILTSSEDIPAGATSGTGWITTPTVSLDTPNPQQALCVQATYMGRVAIYEFYVVAAVR